MTKQTIAEKATTDRELAKRLDILRDMIAIANDADEKRNEDLFGYMWIAVDELLKETAREHGFDVYKLSREVGGRW